MVSTSFILSNIHDVKTKRFTLLEGRIQKSYAKFADATKLAKPDNLKFMTQLLGNAIFGFFAVGALVIVGVVAAAIAGVALATIGVAAACVMGATAIGAMVITAEDAMDGEARSLGDATLDMIAWGLKGLGFFVGGTAFMGLKGIVSVAPYIGQLTSRQMIAGMIGSGIIKSIFSGAGNWGVQLYQVAISSITDGNSGKDSIDRNEVNARMIEGFLPGIMAATGLNLGGQIIFNIALDVESAREDGGDLFDMIFSAVTSGVVNRYGGDGILSDRKTYN